MAITETQLRRIVQDNPDGAGTNILSTDDYSFIISAETQLYRAAAMAAKMLASYFAQKVRLSAGPFSIDAQQKFDHYETLAKNFMAMAEEGYGADLVDAGGTGISEPVITGVSVSEMEEQREDDDRFQPSFRRRQMSNPPLTEEEYENED